MATYDFAIADVSPLPSPWGNVNNLGTLRVVSNLCANSSGTGTNSGMRYTASSIQRSIITYASGTTDGGPALFSSTGNGYIVVKPAGNAQMFRVGNGSSFTQLGASVAQSAWVNGQTHEIVFQGNDVVYIAGGTEIMRRTDSTHRTGVQPSIFMFAANLRFSFWSDGAIDLLTGMPLTMVPGPGVPVHRKIYFIPQRFGSQSSVPNDITLQADLQCVSTVVADLTTIGKTGFIISSGPGVSPDYNKLFVRQRFGSAGNMPNDTSLNAALSCISSVSGSLSTSIFLQSSLVSVSFVNASLSTSIALQASLSALSTLTASLNTAIRLQAELFSISTVTAALDGSAAALQAALTSVSSATAALTTAVRLSANLSSQSVVTSNLSTLIRLESALSCVSTVIAQFSGGAAQLQALLSAISSVTADLTDAIEPLPFAPINESAWQMEGLPLLNNPYCNVPPSKSNGLQARNDIPIGRFGWIDLSAANIGYRRPAGESIAAIVGQFYSFTQAIYFDRGLIWIRNGHPVVAYTRGDFIVRFPGGAIAGDRVYASILDGSPVSGYAVNTLPTQWRVMRTAGPWVPTIISSWEFIQ